MRDCHDNLFGICACKMVPNMHRNVYGHSHMTCSYASVPKTQIYALDRLQSWSTSVPCYYGRGCQIVTEFP
jgi:hypothetical protein